MDKGAKDKLVRPPGENGGGQDAQNIFIQELEGTRRRERPRRGWKEEEERDLQVLGVRRWREFVTDRRKWNDIVRATGQSPQRAVAPMEGEEEEEEEEETYSMFITQNTHNYMSNTEDF